MKKLIALMVLTLIGVNAESSFAQYQMPDFGLENESVSIQQLDQWNYQFELMSAPLAVVAYHLDNHVPDHNGQLIQNLREVSEFYSNYPFLSFYRVEGFSSPVLFKQLGIKAYPTISIYRYGKLVKTVEDVFQLQDLFPLVQEAVENF
jgi:hypothetical protein